VLSSRLARGVRILEDIGDTISFGLGRKNAERVDHELFETPLWEGVIGAKR
jgi:tRNA-splicing ligase RtcB